MSIFFLLYLIIFEPLLYSGFIKDIELFTVHQTPKEARGDVELDIYKIAGDASYLFYYTILSNMLAQGILFLSFFIKNEKIASKMITIAASYMIILLVGFWIFIAPFLGWNYLIAIIDNLFLHLILPLSIIFMWWRYALPTSYKRKTILWTLVFPVIYYIFTWGLYLYVDGKISIYVFIDYYNPFFLDLSHTVYVVIIDIAIAILFFGMCIISNLLLMKIKNVMHRKAKKTIVVND